MTTEKFNFTDTRLSKLSTQNEKRLWVYDTKQQGLAMQVTPSGTRTFKFMAWDNTRKRSVSKTIGTYPKVGLNVARDQARILADDLANGVDIVGKARTKRDTSTLNQAFDRWLKKKKARGKSSWTFDEMRYNKHIRNKFGSKLVTDITYEMLESWFFQLPEKANLSTTSANRVIVIIKTIFNQELRGYDNPTEGLSFYTEKSRNRFLGPSELPAFFEALNHVDTPGYLRDYVLISLFTGARKANVLGMRWGDIDKHLGIWMIPPSESKNREALTIPLIPAVIEILNRRNHDNGKKKQSSLFVFPSVGRARSKSGHLTDPKDAWKKLLDRAGIKNFRIHDLRRSMGSWQTIMGASTTIVGKSLGHKSQQATAVYSQLHLDPIRSSMEKAVDAMLAAVNLPEKIAKIKP